MSRTNGVNLSFVKDCLNNKLARLGYIVTESMCADIFTKFFPSKSKSIWERVHRNFGIYDCEVKPELKGDMQYEGSWLEVIGTPGPGHRSRASRVHVPWRYSTSSVALSGEVT